MSYWQGQQHVEVTYNSIKHIINQKQCATFISAVSLISVDQFKQFLHHLYWKWSERISGICRLTLTALLYYRINCKQVQFCENSHHFTYFLVNKPSNCCIERWQTLFCWIYRLWKAQISIQLTIRCTWPCRSMFSIHIITALMNCNSGWFSSDAILTLTLSIWLLSNGVKGIKRMFMWKSATDVHHMQLP